MSKAPNFEEYTYQTLLEVYGNIDEYKYPERKALVAKLIDQKKETDEAKAFIVETLEVNKYDTFWPRFFAGIIDGLFLTLATYLVGAIAGIFPSWILTAGEYLSIFTIYIYSVAFHAYSGQTVGKYFMSLKVVKNSNEGDINLKHAFIRDSVPVFLIVFALLIQVIAPEKTDNSLDFSDYLLIFVGIFNFIWFFLEILTMLFSEKRRALHDFLAGTVVINT